MTQQQLQEQIALLRSLMERLAEKHGYNLTHPSVVMASQRLDRLIVSYMRGASSSGS